MKKDDVRSEFALALTFRTPAGVRVPRHARNIALCYMVPLVEDSSSTEKRKEREFNRNVLKRIIMYTFACAICLFIRERAVLHRRTHAKLSSYGESS